MHYCSLNWTKLTNYVQKKLNTAQDVKIFFKYSLQEKRSCCLCYVIRPMIIFSECSNILPKWKARFWLLVKKSNLVLSQRLGSGRMNGLDKATHVIIRLVQNLNRKIRYSVILCNSRYVQYSLFKPTDFESSLLFPFNKTASKGVGIRILNT